MEKCFALLGANASGTHRLKPVILVKADKPRAPKDCIHELPVVYYNTINAWFTIPTSSDLFFKHFVPEVRHYQENVLCIAPEEAKALHLSHSAPVHQDSEKLLSEDGNIPTMFLPPSTTWIVQLMDLGVIMSCKRSYQRKYLDEVLAVIEEEEDAKGQRTPKSIKTYNIKSSI